jgi:hypothetical protein
LAKTKKTYICLGFLIVGRRELLNVLVGNINRTIHRLKRSGINEHTFTVEL